MPPYRRYWAYEPRSLNRARQMREANTYMEQQLFAEQLKGQLAQRGIDPDLFAQTANTQFANRYIEPEPEPEQERRGGGGLLGKVAKGVLRGASGVGALGVLDPVTKKVFGGEIRQPWDYLRPLKRAMDWEAKKIGGPIYEELSILGATPIRMAVHGESYGEARATATQRGEKIPSLVSEIGASLYSPSSLLTSVSPATIAKWTSMGPAGRQLAARIPMLDGMYSAAGSNRAVRSVLGLEGGYSAKGVARAFHADEVGGTRLPGRAFNWDENEEISSFIGDLNLVARKSTIAEDEDFLKVGERIIEVDLHGKGSGLSGLREFNSFTDDLIQAYPDHKIVSTVRNSKLAPFLERKGWKVLRSDSEAKESFMIAPSADEAVVGRPLKPGQETYVPPSQRGMAGGPSEGQVPVDLNSIDRSLPVPEGFVRLYRGTQLEQDAIETGTQSAETLRGVGADWTSNLDEAIMYAKNNKRKRGRVYYIEVPETSYAGQMVLNAPQHLRPGGVSRQGLYVQLSKTADAKELGQVFRAKPPSISGGAPESLSMQDLMERTAALPDEAYRARSAMEIDLEASQNKTLTGWVRNNLAKHVLPDRATRMIEDKGIRLTDGDVATALDQRNRLIHIGENTAREAVNEQVRIVLDKSFKIDWDKGVVLDVKGKPLIEDLFENSPDFKLTAQQEAILDLAYQPVTDARATRKAYGIKVHEYQTKSGRVMHRQTISKPVQAVSHKTGEPITIQEGLPVITKSGLRAKQSYRYPRHYATRAEGEAAGNKYLPFLEGQQALIEQEYRTAADEWLMIALEGYGKTPTQVLETTQAGLLASRKSVGARLASIRSLRTTLTNYKKSGYAARGFVDPYTAGKLEALEPDVRLYYDEVVKASKIGKKANRQTAMMELLDTVRKEESRAVSKFRSLSGTRKLELEKLRGGTPERPRVVRGRLFEEEPGREIEELVYSNQASAGAIEKSLIELNDQIRPVMASLDASFMGVQGLNGLFRNPVAYVQSVFHGFSGEAYDAFYEAKRAEGVVASFINHTGHWAVRNDPGEFLFTGRISKLPGFKHANTWFTRFGNSMRLHLYDASMSVNRTDKELDGLARVAGLATGYSAGKVTSIERAGLFAPRFFRSQLGLIATAFGGRGSRIEQREAMRMLVGLIGGGAALTYGINTALGQPTELDHNSPNFMRIRALGKDISVFGPWDTFARAMIKEAGEPGSGTKYILGAKASPGVNLFRAVWEGETRGGGEVDWTSLESALVSAGRLGATAAPISLQQAFDEGIPSTPQEIGGAAVQFLGTKATPLSGGEKRQIARDETAVKVYGKPWDAIEEQQQYELLQANPDLQPGKAESETARAWESFRAIGTESNLQQEQLDAALPAGVDWVDQYKSLRERIAGRYLEWEASHPEILDQLKSREIKDPDKQARIDYFAAFKESQSLWGGLDVDKLSDRLDALEASWTPAQQAYVDRNTGFKATDRVKAYRQASRALRPYWEVEDETWAEVLAARPDLQQYQTIDDYREAKTNELRQLGVPEEALQSQVARLPIFSALQSIVSQKRIQLRATDPKVDALLSLWFGATPLHLQERFQPKSGSAGRKPYRPYSSRRSR